MRLLLRSAEAPHARCSHIDLRELAMAAAPVVEILVGFETLVCGCMLFLAYRGYEDITPERLAVIKDLSALLVLSAFAAAYVLGFAVENAIAILTARGWSIYAHRLARRKVRYSDVTIEHMWFTVMYKSNDVAKDLRRVFDASRLCQASIPLSFVMLILTGIFMKAQLGMTDLGLVPYIFSGFTMAFIMSGIGTSHIYYSGLITAYLLATGTPEGNTPQDDHVTSGVPESVQEPQIQETSEATEKCEQKPGKVCPGVARSAASEERST